MIVIGLLSGPNVGFAEAPRWIELFRSRAEGLQNWGVAGRLRQDAEATRIAQNVGTALPDPVLKLGVTGLATSFNPTQEPMTQAPSIGLSQNIPNRYSARSKGLVERSKASMLGQQAAVESNSQALVAAQSMIRYALIRERESLVQQQKKNLEVLKDSLVAKYQYGRSQAWQIDTLQSEVDTLQIDIWQLQQQQSTVLGAWESMLQGSPITVAADLLLQPESLPADILPSIEHAPQLKVLQEKIGVHEGIAKVAQGAKGLDWSVGLQYGVRGSDRSDLLSAQLGVALPVWAGASAKPMQRGEEIRVAALQSEYRDAFEAVAAESSQLQTNLDLLGRQAAHLNGVVIPTSESALRNTIVVYEAGQEPITTVIAAMNRELKLRRRFIQIMEEMRVTEARLLALYGALFEEQP